MDPVPAQHNPMGKGARQDASALIVLPRHIGKYEVIDRLGSGAFGVVYRCRDAALDRTVAVKVLSTAGHADPDSLERFQRESRAAARFSHPHIVPVFDCGLDGDSPYLVMENVEGQSLDRLIGSPRLTLETTLRVIFHLAQALEAAHEQGVVHRDVKPANVLIDHEGRPKLTDFGLARLATDPGGLSRSGDLLGTPRYMSPEQVLLGHGEVDFRTDIYSLGAVMYEMLAGVPAADGPNPMAVLRKISDEEPVPLRQLKEQVPEEVAAICQRMMAKDRDLRYPTAQAVATDIQAFMLRKMLGTPEIELLAGLPAPQPRRWPWPRPRYAWAIATAAAAVFLLVGFAAARLTFPSGPRVKGLPPGLPAIDLKRLVTRGRSELQTLSSAADARTYHDGLSDLLEDLNAAIKQYADDPELRLVRGKLLRRAGEYLAAMTDLDKAAVLDDPEVVLERGLARFQWEHLYLGSLPEPALRPAASASIRADLAKLAAAADPELRFVSRIAEALTAGRSAEALKLALQRPERASERLKADLLMLEADAFGGAAQATHQELQAAAETKKADLRDRRDEFDARAAQAVRRGLEASPHHPGLLFLRAGGWHRRIIWESADGEDQDRTMRRHRSGFEAAYQRFRAASPRIGVESSTGRAVLLLNYGRQDLALDQLIEAAARRTLPPPVAALHAWLQLQSPPDGELSPAHAGQVLQHLEPAFETPPEEFSLYLVRALTHAAIGRWYEARRDLLDGKRRYRGGAWPPTEGNYAEWCRDVGGPPVKFLDATIIILWNLPTPADLRIRLQDELIKGLTGPDDSLRRGIPLDEVRSMTGWGHYRLARFWADKDDRSNVLKHMRLALAFRLPNLGVDTLKDDPVIQAWNNEADFSSLYAEFAKP
ncbi:MAG: protein kinase [Planctomycetaceae bacterium]|nr:protein kinase [Planctomycetaceae bacterium]